MGLTLEFKGVFHGVKLHVMCIKFELDSVHMFF